MSDIREFQITWKRELFFKNKSTLLTAKCLIKKSIVIAQNKSSQQLNHLTIVHKLNISLAKYLQERLEILQNEIDNYNHQIKNLTEQEKDYWKQFADIIEKRTNSHQQPKSESTSSNTRPVLRHKDENIPPLEYKSMHKPYQPIFPTSNRILQKKWDDKNYSEHRLLIRDARASIDTRPPKTYMHLHMKLKKLQLEEERAAKIERDNRILLEKMSIIMRTTGGINSRNDYEPKSLNQEKRRKELLRVSKENATLAKRIIDCRLDTNRENWKSSWSKNAAYLDNISKFEPDWHGTNSAVLQAYSEKPVVKRSQSETREDKKGIKALVNTNETATTKIGNDKTQQ